MNLNEFQKLKTTIEDQDFHSSFMNINRVMFGLSIFGHLASIFLAFFLVQKILSGAIVDNPLLVNMSSIILLGGLELLKREIFDKFSLQHIKIKSITSKAVMPLMIASMLIVSLSFYATITGAKEFSSKADQIETQASQMVDLYEDSLTVVYNDRKSQIESEIVLKKQKIEAKDVEQTQIEANQPLSGQQRTRVRDLKTERGELKSEITQLEQKIAKLDQELIIEVENHKTTVQSEAENKKTENQTNTVLFVFISILIEFMILAGVYFNEYFKFRSYDEFKVKIENDPNFQKWYKYNSVLDSIYSEDTKINDRLPSGKTIQDLCRVNGIILLNKDVTELFKLFTSLGITKSVGSAKYFAKSKDLAHESLRKHFGIK